MSKLITTTLITMLCLVQTFLPATTFAAARTLQDIGLTPNDVKHLTPAQVKDILDTATVNYTDNDPSATATDPLIPNTVNCFDYYSFGSVQANLFPSVSNAIAGGPITFSGNIVNDNAYPIVGGKLIVKIFKTTGNGQKNVNADDVVDEFDAATNVHIPAKGTVPVSIDWKVPAYMDSGSYKAVTFFTVADKFNLLGLTFTDDIVGNTSDFSIVGESQSVRFNKNEVKINGGKFYFAAYPPRIGDAEVKITAEIVNTTAAEQSIPVKWKVYSWDAQHESNFIKEYTELVKVGANGKAIASYSLNDMESPVYYVKAEAGYKDTKSIIGVRFVRPEANKFRINFPAVTKFPLQKGEAVDLFSCLHATNDSAIPTEGKLVLTLKDKLGKTIHSYEYKGFVTSAMMGVKDTFTPDKKYENFTLKAELYQGEKLADSVELVYDCKAIDPSACSNQGAIIKMILGILAVIIVIVAIVMLVLKRKPKTAVTALVLLLAFGWSISASDTSAENWWEGTVLPGEARWEGTAPRMATSWGGQKTELENVHIKVRYRTQVTKESGEVLQGGETLPAGAKLNFKFLPNTSDNIYWFGLGGVFDSPFGEWRAGATPPAAGCQDKDFLNVGVAGIPMVSSLSFRYLFFDLVMTPPTREIGDLQNLTCGAINADGVASCTVLAEGPVNAAFKFQPGTGKFYYSYFQTPLNGSIGGVLTPPALSTVPAASRAACLMQSEPFGGYTVSVPALAASYTFTATNNPTNQPPSAPQIDGPTQGLPGQAYDFGFVSTDPNGDDVNYIADFATGGSAAAIVRVPSENYVAQAMRQSLTKTWTSVGIYTFQVKAEDRPGLASGWTTHTIEIKDSIDDTDTTNPVTPPTGCIPGQPGCVNSCGTFAPIATGFGLNVNSPNLCVQGGLVSGFGRNADRSGWTWGCKAITQAIPQVCTGVCASGHANSAGKCVDSPDDYCPNIDGVQNNPAAYDIDSEGNCLPRASITYFKFNPDTDDEFCPAYWETVMPAANLGFTSACTISGDASINGHAVTTSNPSTTAGKDWFLKPVGLQHTLTCKISDSLGIVRKTLDAKARCYRIGEVIER